MNPPSDGRPGPRSVVRGVDAEPGRALPATHKPSPRTPRARTGEMSTCAESPCAPPWGVRQARRPALHSDAFADRVCRSYWTRASLHRVDQHALRPAQRAYRQKAPFPYAVVDRSPRDAEQFGGVIERNTAADTGFKTGFRHLLRRCHKTSRMSAYMRNDSARHMRS